MDAFGDLLRGVRAHGSVFGYPTLSAPWSLDFVDGPPLTLGVILDGAGWIVQDGREPLRVTAGTTVVIRGPETFGFVDEPGTTAIPEACGEHCSAPAVGGALHHRGWGACGEASADTTSMIVGAYPVRGEIGDRLLGALPPVIRIPGHGNADPIARLIAAEVSTDRPGQQAVLDRLLDWLLVCALRDWFDFQDDAAPQWYSALHDPIVGDALNVMHSELDTPWTVSTLARRVGVSRATLAKRFTDLVGEPPLTYLTRWRMTVAADRLADRPDLTIAEVAREVGYADAFTFSTAFKRTTGVNPSSRRVPTTGPEKTA
ncbi:AraC family transcriptional regulator [Gordonia soli]|uniref:Putative AraC family transcriptional regulator n=1 Tax=Gordonia soli NBRC 108243 TaxID=1223545 RepID=M0QID7_9ACTN|nr:AraC family transcriptional regulator [Gordonia soli]GAC67202.1 putative AraC family transcriptional regulator [Gordonia soli NBRC 108243]